ncbi:MAG: hypothetical protein ABII64_03385 [Elusimicrobiota bacterium]
MEIQTINTPAQFDRFIKFPWSIYKNDRNWVPPLLMDVKFNLKENPFWEHSERELFMAYDNSGKPMGRIAAIVDHNYIRFHDEPVGFFGFYESENNPVAAKALFDKAGEWLKSKGIEMMRGPMNPSTNDECGFLCEGFDEMPRLMMPYNPRYYLNLAEQCELKKAKELYAYEMDISNGPIERLKRIAEMARKKNPGLIVRSLNMKDWEKELQRALSVYNAAWEKNWAFVPWTKKEFMTVATRMKSLFYPDTTLIAELGGKPVGLLIAVPDYNFVMKKMNGRLFPFGILKFMFYKNKIKALRLMIMGVVKEHRLRGIEGVMYYEALRNSLRKGFEKCEFSWILDDNIMTQRGAEMMGGKLYKKYRIYERQL